MVEHHELLEYIIIALLNSSSVEHNHKIDKIN